jgi:hypothetical protein
MRSTWVAAAILSLACGRTVAAKPETVLPGTAGKVNGATGGGPATKPAVGPLAVSGCPRSGTPGAWENITPRQVSLDPDFNTGAGKNFGTNSFVIDPKNPAVIYLGTSAMGVYKSSDCGASWARINTGRGGDELDRGRQWTMVIDPVETQVLYTVAGYGKSGVFKSTDGGVSWKQILPPSVAKAFIYDGFTARIRMDPTDHRHLLVTPHFTCEGRPTNSCLLETTDAGATWRIVDGVPPAVEGTGIFMVDRSTWYWAQGFGGLWRTTDSGRAWKHVANKEGYAFDSLYIAPDGSYFVPAAFGLIRSNDKGLTWNGVPDSPRTNVVAGSATRIYVSIGSCVGAADEPYQPFMYAPVSNPTKWTTLTGPPRKIGGGDLQYEPRHKVLYSSSCLGGFWRLATE